MNCLLAVSGGLIGGIVAAVAVVAVAVVLLVVFLRRKPSSKFIEYKGDNQKLFDLIEVDKSEVTAPFIVPPTHCAFLIRNGTALGPYEPGEYPTYEGRDAKSAAQTIHSLKIIYISKTVRVRIGWGTQEHERFKYREPKLGVYVSVGAFGTMDIGVRDAKKFYERIVASNLTYSAEDLQKRLRALTVDDVNATIESVLKKKEVPFTEFTTEKRAIQKEVNAVLSDHFVPDYGIEIENFLIENINIPKEEEDAFYDLDHEESAKARADKQKREEHERAREEYERSEEAYGWEKAAARRRKRDKIEDREIDDALYTHDRDREREEQAYERNLQHEDEDRTWAREDKVAEREAEREDKAAEREERMFNKGLDVQSEVEKSRNEAIASIAAAEAASDKSAPALSVGHHCSVCGTAYKPGAKYCPGCGSVLPREDEHVACPSCGKQVPWGTQFCPFCGNKVVK